MEGTSLNTVTAAYAPRLVDNYMPVLVRYGLGGTHFLTTGFGAVHTTMTGEEPVYLSISFYFGKSYPEPGFTRKLRGIFITAPVNRLYPVFYDRDFFVILIPLLTGYLATATGSTSCCVI
jgi:hypothetical protein